MRRDTPPQRIAHGPLLLYMTAGRWRQCCTSPNLRVVKGIAVSRYSPYTLYRMLTPSHGGKALEAPRAIQRDHQLRGRWRCCTSMALLSHATLGVRFAMTLVRYGELYTKPYSSFARLLLRLTGHHGRLGYLANTVTGSYDRCYTAIPLTKARSLPQTR